MDLRKSLKTLTLGTSLAGLVALGIPATAAASSGADADLTSEAMPSGYSMDVEDGKCGAGKCGADKKGKKKKDGKDDKDKDGKKKKGSKDGSCGEGSCGG